MERMGTIIGKGKLIIEGKEYPFENRVNRTFDSAVNYVLGMSALTGQNLTISGLTVPVVNGFSLFQESPSINEQKTYTELGYVAKESFIITKQDLYSTTIQASASISQAGTVRGGGFNIVSKVPKSMSVNRIWRNVRLSVLQSLSLPFANGWMYHQTFKKLLGFDSNGIHILEFDHETGLFGDYTNITAASWVNHNRIISDGDKRFIAFSDNQTLKVFNCETEVISTVSLPETVNNWNSTAQPFVWDDIDGCLRSCHQQYIGATLYNGVKIYLDGTIEGNTGYYNISAGTLQRFREDFIVGNSAYYTYNATPGILANFQGDVNYLQRALFKNDIYMYIDFDGTTPTIATCNWRKMPETYYSILGVSPAISVYPGNAFSIEYTFLTGGA